jgi:hypothetical protein
MGPTVSTNHEAVNPYSRCGLRETLPTAAPLRVLTFGRDGLGWRANGPNASGTCAG